MDTTKIRELIADMQHQRNVFDAAIVHMQAALSVMEGAAIPMENGTGKREKTERESYITDTILILETAGKPLHMTEIMEKIVEKRGNTAIARNSVEASINRHITKTKAAAKIMRAAPSTYALPGYRQPAPVLFNQQQVA